ncbi:hypothetical protein [Companilactobacillus alimentarius]|uniref:hypothetical protein n=1 Tax=Companilactobacillus alimentarius TaxID=1602 RepID=UPI0028B8CAE0|nr:hypothetical protein [Companilactobacillus alimentarius]MDT6953197.1 hypothetical protein [Companilactobacillus alimentarius]
MNKTKVMQILNSIDLGLNIIEEGQQLDTQALTESVRTDVEDLKEELNSKPVMPKVFDEFSKQFDLTEQQGSDCLDGALDEVYTMYMHGGSKFEELEEYMRNNGDEDFYSKCVYALVNGYEVEK